MILPPVIPVWTWARKDEDDEEPLSDKEIIIGAVVSILFFAGIFIVSIWLIDKMVL
jgi:hypothetical protein